MEALWTDYGKADSKNYGTKWWKTNLILCGMVISCWYDSEWYIKSGLFQQIQGKQACVLEAVHEASLEHR